MDGTDGFGGAGEGGDVTVLGVVADGSDDDFGGAGDGERARKDHVGLFVNFFGAGEAMGVFGDGIGFAGEHGFVGEQPRFFDDAAVGGDAFAFGEQDNIAGDELCIVDVLFGAVPDDADGLGDGGGEGAEDAVGGELLDIVDEGVSTDDNENQGDFGPSLLDDG